MVRGADGYFRDGEYWYDEAAAQRAVDFFRLFLVHSKGEWAGQPFELADWQADDIIRPLFGWKRMDGTRRYTRCDVWVPRKNGKSTLGAGVMNYLTIADGEPGAEVYGVANDIPQAKIIFKEASGMVKKSPDLSEMCQVFTSSIVVPETLSSYQVVSSEAKNKDGLNISGLGWDEIHECRDAELYEKLTTASASRRQPLMFVMSTAGYDQNTIGYREYSIDRKILDGKIRKDDRLVVIYEAGPKDDWKKEETWRKANPGWGTSVKPNYIRAQFEEARTDPAKEGAFKRYHLNIWTSQKTSWMDMDAWDKCAGPVEIPAGAKCWGGMDLSKRSDITAFALCHKTGEAGQEVYHVKVRFFVPEEGIEQKEIRDGVPYREWATRDLIRLTPGNVIDYDFIRKDIQDAAREFDLAEVGYDPYGATQLALQLTDDGITCVEFPQNIKHISHPTKELKNLILQGRIRHGGNPVLRWMAENCKVVTDANDNQKVTKKDQVARVDGIVATIMALGRAIVGADQSSVYEHRGLKSL